MVWCSSRHYYVADPNRWWAPGLSGWWNDFNQGFAEYTVADVIVFVADFEQNPIGFSKMVDWMTLARDYYRQQIRTVLVAAHGSDTGWRMGEWMSTSNYTSFQSDWVRWGTLMTADAQLVSIACLVGQATTMLNAIAAWSGCDIFANTNATWAQWNFLADTGGPEYFSAAYWNHNMRDTF